MNRLYLLGCLTLILYPISNFAQVKVYPAPAQSTSFYDKSQMYSVTVNDEDAFVYDFDPSDTLAIVPSSMDPKPQNWDPGVFTYFDFKGTVTIKVTVTGMDVTTATIRPKSLGISTSINGNTVTFELSKPCNFGLEINDNMNQPLFIFANPIKPVPDKNDPNVVFLGGNKIYYNYTYPSLKGKTLYIEGGSIVCGKALASDLSGAKILGSGIITGTKPNSDQHIVGWTPTASNVEFNGPIVLSSTKGGKWAFVPFDMDGGKFTNIKVIGLFRDAFDPVSCRNLSIDSSFFWCRDDAFAIKASHYSGKPVYNITVQNCVTWNHGLAIGFETDAPYFRNITFKNNDIVRFNGNSGNPKAPQFYEALWNPVLGIMVSDQANISNIRYEDIRVEYPWTDCVFQFMVDKNYATTNDGKGSINGVYIKNISFIDIDPRLTNIYRSICKGLGADNKVSNVLIEGLVWNGVEKTSISQCGFLTNGFTTNIKVQALASRANAPNAPSQLTVKTLSGSQTLLTWTDNATNEDGFRIERKKGNGDFTEIERVVANFNNYYDLALEDGVTYTYRISAYNEAGTSAFSNEEAVTIVQVQSPFLKNPSKIPGTIEVENYDFGGEGVAYHDVDAVNSGNKHRTDGVDIETCSEGTNNVGWTKKDEWLEYSVSVATSGIYQIEARVASAASSGKFHLEFDGVNKTGAIAVPATGDWQTWKSVKKTGITLNEGTQIMRIYIDGGDFNLNKLIITPEATGLRQTADPNSENDKTFTVYPNPSDGVITFENQVSEIESLSITDSAGRLMFLPLNKLQQIGSHYSLNFKDLGLKTETYIMSLKFKNGMTKTSKIIIQ